MACAAGRNRGGMSAGLSRSRTLVPSRLSVPWSSQEWNQVRPLPLRAPVEVSAAKKNGPRRKSASMQRGLRIKHQKAMNLSSKRLFKDPDNKSDLWRRIKPYVFECELDQAVIGDIMQSISWAKMGEHTTRLLPRRLPHKHMQELMALDADVETKRKLWRGLVRRLTAEVRQQVKELGERLELSLSVGSPTLRLKDANATGRFHNDRAKYALRVFVHLAMNDATLKAMLLFRDKSSDEEMLVGYPLVTGKMYGVHMEVGQSTTGVQHKLSTYSITDPGSGDLGDGGEGPFETACLQFVWDISAQLA